MHIKTNISNRANYGSVRNLSTIKYIVIHYTANDGDSDENNGIYFKNNVVQASAHYFVDDDSVTQTVPDNYCAYHCGAYTYKHSTCRNNNSIGIEICDNVKNGIVYPTEKTLQNTIALTKSLMKKYNIPKENVIRHYDVTGKLCPMYWIDNTKWCNEFWNKLSIEITEPKEMVSILNQYHFPITEPLKFIRELEEAKKNNASLYWGYYKLVNNIK